MFFKLLASLLNCLTDWAQVPVSTLGNIFKTKFWPLKSANVLVDKSVAVSLKSGAFVPTLGKLPEVCIEFPFKVNVAIILYLFWNVKITNYLKSIC